MGVQTQVRTRGQLPSHPAVPEPLNLTSPNLGLSPLVLGNRSSSFGAFLEQYRLAILRWPIRPLASSVNLSRLATSGHQSIRTFERQNKAASNAALSPSLSLPDYVLLARDKLALALSSGAEVVNGELGATGYSVRSFITEDKLNITSGNVARVKDHAIRPAVGAVCVAIVLGVRELRIAREGNVCRECAADASAAIARYRQGSAIMHKMERGRTVAAAALVAGPCDG